MNINRTGLFNNRGLKTNENILSHKRGLKDIELTTKIIYEIINEDENDIVFDVKLKEFSFSVNTKNKLNKVYNKFHNLYNNDVNKFNSHFKDLHWFSGEKLDNDDILNDVREKMYWSKNPHTLGSKRPEKIQYKKEINESILK